MTLRVLATGAVIAVLAASLQGPAQAAPNAAATIQPASAQASVGAARATSDWGLKIRTAEGKRLRTVTLKNGRKSPRLVVGDSYKVTGKVPASVLTQLKGHTVRLQSRSATGGAWKSVKKIHMRKSGAFTAKFDVTKKLLHKRAYRVTANLKSRSGGLSATATTSSSTTTATAVVQYEVVLNNDSGDNLVITVPTAQTSARNYTPSSFDLDNNQSVTMVYTNPPPGNALVWSVQKQNCFGPNCTTYRTSWTYTPTRDSVPCSSASPQITSGSSYTVWMKPQFGSGYDGYFAGPLAGAGSATTTCTFQLVEEIDNWIENNPAKAFAAIVVAVVIVAIVVVATVSTGGADLVVADETLDIIALDEGWDDPEAVFDLIDPNYIPQ